MAGYQNWNRMRYQSPINSANNGLYNNYSAPYPFRNDTYSSIPSYPLHQSYPGLPLDQHYAEFPVAFELWSDLLKIMGNLDTFARSLKDRWFVFFDLDNPNSTASLILSPIFSLLHGPESNIGDYGNSHFKEGNKFEDPLLSYLSDPNFKPPYDLKQCSMDIALALGIIVQVWLYRKWRKRARNDAARTAIKGFGVQK